MGDIFSCQIKLALCLYSEVSNKRTVHSVPKGWQNLFSLFYIFGCFYVYKEQKRSIFHTYVLFSLRRATFKFTCSTTLKQYRLIYVLKWANFGTFLCNSTQKYAKTSYFFMFTYPLETTYFIFTYCNILEHCQIRANFCFINPSISV